jgi:hypothetical protein
MSEFAPNDISPFVAETYLYATLTQNADVVALVGVRVAKGRNGFDYIEFLSDEAKADPARHGEAWPFVLFTEDGDAQLDTYSSDLVLQRQVFLVRAFAREDFNGADFEDDAGRVYRKLLLALQGVEGEGEVDGEFGGQLHECQLLPERHARTYGEKPKRVCEMGVRVRISTT